MRVKDVMNKTPICCTATDSSQRAAEIMRTNQVGSVPVVGDLEKKHLLGIVTDRDLSIKLIAEGRPASTPVSAAMTEKPVTCHADDSLESCESLMQKHQIRRIPVVDRQGQCVGMVAQADVVLHDNAQHVLHTLSAISKLAPQRQHATAIAS